MNEPEYRVPTQLPLDPPSQSRGVIVVVEDNFHVAQIVAMWVFMAGWEARVASTVRSGRAAVTEPVDGVIVDLRLTDGKGFEVIVDVRSRQPNVPVLVFTGSSDNADTNYAQTLGVEFARKPGERENILRFLQRCEDFAPNRAGKMVAAMAATHRFTKAHVRLIWATLETTSRKALAEKLGYSIDTVNSHARVLLKRTRAASLDDLAAPIRAVALQGIPRDRRADPEPGASGEVPVRVDDVEPGSTEEPE